MPVEPEVGVMPSEDGGSVHEPRNAGTTEGKETVYLLKPPNESSLITP